MGRPKGALNKDKPFREALRMEIAAAGSNLERLRKLARKLLSKGDSGDMTALKEIADRLDGKVPQGIVGDAENDTPIKVVIRKFSG